MKCYNNQTTQNQIRWNSRGLHLKKCYKDLGNKKILKDTNYNIINLKDSIVNKFLLNEAIFLNFKTNN